MYEPGGEFTYAETLTIISVELLVSANNGSAPPQVTPHGVLKRVKVGGSKRQ